MGSPRRSKRPLAQSQVNLVCLATLATMILLGVIPRAIEISEPVDAKGAKVLEAGAKRRRIPSKMFTTHRYESFEDLPENLRWNLQQTIDLNPTLKFQYFSDKMCADAVLEVLGPKGLDVYNRVKRGCYRGDICRAVILYQEGGYYFDADTSWQFPFQELTGNATTFVTIWSWPGILNAFQGSTQGNAFIKRTLDIMMKTVVDWDSWKNDDGLFGPRKYLDAIYEMVSQDCDHQRMQIRNSINLEYLPWRLWAEKLVLRLLNIGHEPDLTWACGEEVLNMYHEHHFECPSETKENRLECTEERARTFYESNFDGVRWGIYKPSIPHTEKDLVGWSRFASCASPGCDGERRTTSTTTVPHRVGFWWWR